jgi:hypothetical protein
MLSPSQPHGHAMHHQPMGDTVRDGLGPWASSIQCVVILSHPPTNFHPVRQFVPIDFLFPPSACCLADGLPQPRQPPAQHGYESGAGGDGANPPTVCGAARRAIATTATTTMSTTTTAALPGGSNSSILHVLWKRANLPIPPYLSRTNASQPTITMCQRHLARLPLSQTNIIRSLPTTHPPCAGARHRSTGRATTHNQMIAALKTPPPRRRNVLCAARTCLQTAFSRASVRPPRAAAARMKTPPNKKEARRARARPPAHLYTHSHDAVAAGFLGDGLLLAG